ncbi:hypothetical protein C8Q80DRAFT_676759 [Daedaleopsis nitida]|nr:hypothetical protein C8Q80DRAFT_676759 [Daedaleopsis nitida]
MAPTVTPESIASANLGSVCFQSALYGIFLVLSCIALALLAFRHSNDVASRPSISSHKSRWGIWKSPLFVTTVILFVMVTVQWIVSVFRAFDGFIYFEGGRAPALYFLDFTKWAEVVVNALTVFAQVICDGMITYRTWIVWNRNYKVLIFPILALLGLLAGCIGLVYEETHITSVFAKQVDLWITADAILTLSINVYGTAMIAYRIWSATRKTRSVGMRTGRLQRVLSIFIESAALYTFWSLFFIITYRLRSNLHYPGSNCWPQISGIAYMLITVRIGLGWAHQGSFSPLASGTMGVISTGHGTTSAAAHGASQRSVPQTYPLRTINIEVSRDMEQHVADTPKGDKYSGGPFAAY